MSQASDVKLRNPALKRLRSFSSCHLLKPATCCDVCKHRENVVVLLGEILFHLRNYTPFKGSLSKHQVGVYRIETSLGYTVRHKASPFSHVALVRMRPVADHPPNVCSRCDKSSTDTLLYLNRRVCVCVCVCVCGCV